jgi:hypothetical protein
MRPFLLALTLLVPFALVGCPPRAERDKETKNEKPAEIKHQVGDLAALKTRVKAALDEVHGRDLRTDNSFWTVFHGILGMGLDAQLYDPVSRTRVNAMEHIRKGGKLPGLEFVPYEDGLDVKTVSPDTLTLQYIGQGHQDQFIAEMIQVGLPLDSTFLVKGKEYSFKDFCRYSKARASVNKDQELSWAIIVIGQVYSTKHEWENQDGEKLTFEDVVRYELNQPITERAACGGTHRLFGLAWAYNLHRKEGGEDKGVWKEVADKMVEYRNRAKSLRNGDGSFSTQYLKERENDRNPDKRIGSTGHVFEWLALALPDRELTADWMQEAAFALSAMILDRRKDAIDSGSLYHASHGLHLYYDRLFGKVNDNVPLPPK